ncbi:MAG: HAD-IB family hydrolase [Deltaproteobacteria bacterium]|nr:MAG: HAD-IB family hydrolase [Deltaproteobacteria bacterium]
MAIVVFDVDNTLIHGTAGEIFVRHLVRTGWIPMRRVLPLYRRMLDYLRGRCEFPDVIRAGGMLYRGLPLGLLQLEATRCFTFDLRRRLSPDVLVRFYLHRARGEEIVLASGSHAVIIEPLAAFLEVETFFAPELIVSERGRITGEVREPLCFGEGKLALVEAFARKRKVPPSEITFYTDNYSDLPALRRFGRPVVVNPGRRLRREARRNRWETIEVSDTERPKTLFDHLSQWIAADPTK